MNIEASFIVLEPWKICRASEYSLFTHFFFSGLFILISIETQDKINSKYFSCNKEQLLSGDYRFHMKVQNLEFSGIILNVLH